MNPYRLLPRAVLFGGLGSFVILSVAISFAPASADAPSGPPVPLAGSQFVAPPVNLPQAAIVGSPGPFVGLTLQDATAMALLRNTDLSISESDRRIAYWNVVSARGPFDLRFVLSPSYQYEKTAPLSPFNVGPNGVPTTQQTNTLTTGITGISINGTQYAINASASRIEGNSTANGYDPYFPTALSFAITQPLGRGRYGPERRDLALAVATSSTQGATTLIQASNSISTVISAYWNLLAAWRSLGIQEQSLLQARAQTESNNRLVARGNAAPLDIAESNTQVDVDTDNVLSATASVARLENQLKSLILDDPGDQLWSVNFVPTSPIADVPPEPNLADITMSAIHLRPELAQVRASRESANATLAYARDLAKPQVDLKLQYTSNGFAGDPGNINANPLFAVLGPEGAAINKLAAANPAAGVAQLPSFTTTALPGTTGQLGTSFSSLFKNEYPVYGAQLNFGLPIHDDRAIGSLRSAQERERQVDVQQRATLQRIVYEARNAVQSFDAAKSRVVAAHAAREAADRVLAGEQRRFRVGESTTFLVLQRQVEDANDQGRELQAQTDLNIAISELDRVSGAIFAKNGFTVADGLSTGKNALRPLSAGEHFDPASGTDNAGKRGRGQNATKSSSESSSGSDQSSSSSGNNAGSSGGSGGSNTSQVRTTSGSAPANQGSTNQTSTSQSSTNQSTQNQSSMNQPSMKSSTQNQPSMNQSSTNQPSSSQSSANANSIGGSGANEDDDNFGSSSGSIPTGNSQSTGANFQSDSSGAAGSSSPTNRSQSSGAAAATNTGTAISSGSSGTPTSNGSSTSTGSGASGSSAGSSRGGR